ncbi:23S rRNA (uracil(1939)-C(5))-methyltransferase RlmD [Holdemanella biformis]|uniref:23S rRNA (uracil(1939)-C(5))-methyltransferase RlmD n=1 Tax=Holdemanella biformis TaxID=1735 RepID=UPI00249313C4|nr:23S rRNA (uracil(1939)-C(5))-methyltransferase RlmD [Holdemanella biformis]
MKKNEEYIVTCIDDTDLNSGVVKIDDMVVFVPNLLIGEKAKIKIVKVNKKYAFGIIIELLKPSINRQELTCKVAKTCGGCQLQHMSYAYQLDYKYKHVKKLFEDIEVKPILGMDNPWYYRNKAQFPVKIKDGKVQMGFYRQHSNDVVTCKECKIQDHVINEVFSFIQKKITLKMAQDLRHVFIRHSSTDEIQVVFIGKNEKNIISLSDQLKKTFANIKSIVFNYNTRNDNVILGDTYKVLYGNDSIIEECLGNKVKLHFKAFFQVNPKQMEVLYSQAIKAANLSGNETCIDMYAGTGTIGMAVSKHAKSVIGVEIVKEAVDNANDNTKMNHLDHCHYVCQDATDFAHDHKEDKIDVIFIDPPRKGMTENGIKDTITMQPDKIVYVSCNPKTLSRDLKIFKEYGYQCEYVQPVDMFCQTIGLECVAKLTKIV